MFFRGGKGARGFGKLRLCVVFGLEARMWGMMASLNRNFGLEVLFFHGLMSLCSC